MASVILTATTIQADRLRQHGRGKRGGANHLAARLHGLMRRVGEATYAATLTDWRDIVAVASSRRRAARTSGGWQDLLASLEMVYIDDSGRRVDGVAATAAVLQADAERRGSQLWILAPPNMPAFTDAWSF